MNSTTQESHNELGPGRHLSVGMVLEVKERDSIGREMPGRHGIAICFLAHNSLHPFVVWNYVAPFHKVDNAIVRGLPYAIQGEYCESIIDAVKAFERRQV